MSGKPKARRAGLVVILVAGLCAVAVVAQAGGIEGTVVIKKKLTKRRVTAEVSLYERGPAVAIRSDSVPDQDPLSMERSRVAIYLEGPSRSGTPVDPANRESPPPMSRMEQTNRRFSPEVLLIQAGGKVSFPNLDPIFHNVFSLSGAKAFDLGNYPKGDTRVVSFPEPGIVYVNCHLHSNMTATIVVAPNKWNVMADGDGRFELRDVPPGKYTIVAWHKAAGYFRQNVVVTPDGNESVQFLIPVDENGHKLEGTKPEGTKLAGTNLATRPRD